MTVACARCHDHKFDPIPQRDYYALAGIFLSTDTRYGTAQARAKSALPPSCWSCPPAPGAPTLARTLSAEERTRKEDAARGVEKGAARNRCGAGRATRRCSRAAARQRFQIVLTQIGALETELKSFDANGHAKALAMGVQDRPAAAAGAGRFPPSDHAANSRLNLPDALAAGQLSSRSPTARFSPAATWTSRAKKCRADFRSLLSSGAKLAIAPASSGRRELAEWLTAPENPLTARVLRTGSGTGSSAAASSRASIISAPRDKPSKPGAARSSRDAPRGEWLVVKKTIREIVLSRTYQLSSAFDEKASPPIRRTRSSGA